MMKKITIYCDGACSGNPGKGGWGAILFYGTCEKEISGHSPYTTNNQMELTAAIEALKILKEKCQIEIYTDSEYLRKGITEWIYNWMQNDWKKAKDKKIKNLELWQLLYQLSQQHEIAWHWVKGHSDNVGNIRADKLATQAVKNIRAN